MAFSFPKKLIGKTPENVADVQSNFDAAEAEFNQDLAGDVTGPRDSNTLSRIARAFTRFGLLGAFNSTNTTVSYGFNVGEDGKLIDTAKAGWSMELSSAKVRFYYAAPTSGTPSFVEKFSIDSNGNLSSAGGFPAGSIGSSQIIDGSIVNADINGAAAIAYAKLALTGSITNADVAAAAAIAESKLNLASDGAAGTPTKRSLGKTSTKAASGSDTEYAFSTWKKLQDRPGQLLSGAGSDTYLCGAGDPEDSSPPIAGARAKVGFAFRFDPDDFDANRTTMLRVVLVLGTGGNAPAQNFSARLCHIDDVAGSVPFPKINVVSSRGNPATLADPGASLGHTAVGAGFNTSTVPEGRYCLVVQTSGGSGSLNGAVGFNVELQMRQT